MVPRQRIILQAQDDSYAYIKLQCIPRREFRWISQLLKNLGGEYQPRSKLWKVSTLTFRDLPHISVYRRHDIRHPQFRDEPHRSLTPLDQPHLDQELLSELIAELVTIRAQLNVSLSRMKETERKLRDGAE